MNLVFLPASTYLWLLIVAMVVEVQVMLIAWAIGNLAKGQNQLYGQVVQVFRQAAKLSPEVANVFTEVQKGNKDQQEIKTKLTNLKQNVQIIKEKAFPVHIVGKAVTSGKAGKTIKVITGKKTKMNKRG